jgi:simple sugar transport system permease protein
VVNLGIEGLMLMAAFSSFTFDFATKNPFVGIIGSLGVVAALGLVFCFLTITLNVDQIVAGLGIYLFGLGLSGVLYAIFTAGAGVGASGVPTVPKLELPVLAGIPFIGAILFQQNLLVYLSLLLVPAVWYLLTKTGLGLRVRAVGENPKAADTMGISVPRVRYIATMTGAILAGVSGAYLAVGYTGSFELGYTLGRGFIALAMVYLSNWNPFKAFAGIFVYDFIDSLQSAIVINTPSLQSSSYLLDLLPYIFVIGLIPLFGRKARAPKYLTLPYRKS